MNYIYKALKDSGKIFIGIPVGKDALVFNKHRIYGKLRLPLLFKKFKIINWTGFNPINLSKIKLGEWKNQPVLTGIKIL